MYHDQANALRSRFGTHKKNAKTIAIVSGKGGVGKSSTIINLAIKLQEKEKKTLLIDLDVGMGNVDILLGTNSNHSIIDLFNDYMSIHDIIEIGPKGLAYIAGGTGLTELFNMNNDMYARFKQQYEQLLEQFDYIFFDLGAGVTRESLSFVLAADECYVVMTPEPTAITDGYSMIKHIVHHERDMPISIILNQCNHRKQCFEVVRNIRKTVLQFLEKDITILGLLPSDTIVQRAAIKQVPYVLLNKSAPITKSITNMAKDIVHGTNTVTTAKRLSFVQRLKQMLTMR